MILMALMACLQLSIQSSASPLPSVSRSAAVVSRCSRESRREISRMPRKMPPPDAEIASKRPCYCRAGELHGCQLRGGR